MTALVRERSTYALRRGYRRNRLPPTRRRRDVRHPAPSRAVRLVDRPPGSVRCVRKTVRDGTPVGGIVRIAAFDQYRRLGGAAVAIVCLSAGRPDNGWRSERSDRPESITARRFSGVASAKHRARVKRRIRDAGRCPERDLMALGSATMREDRAVIFRHHHQRAARAVPKMRQTRSSECGGEGETPCQCGRPDSGYRYRRRC